MKKFFPHRIDRAVQAIQNDVANATPQRETQDNAVFIMLIVYHSSIYGMIFKCSVRLNGHYLIFNEFGALCHDVCIFKKLGFLEN